MEGHRKKPDGLFEDRQDAEWMCADSTVIEVEIHPMHAVHPLFTIRMLPGSDVTWPSIEARALITRVDAQLIHDLARDDRLGGIVQLAKDGMLDPHVRDHS